MSDNGAFETIEVGAGDAARAIAVAQRAGGAPGLFWLGGFKSDMAGTKAVALDDFGARQGLAVTRFDYSGHGRSGGAFLDGTISRWLDEALTVFSTSTTGPQIVVGSSMGGWLALLLNRAVRQAGDRRVSGLVLIAPAVDMTEDLMRATFSPQDLADLETKGRVEQPSDYSDAPYVLTRGLIEDGARHLMFGAPIETGCPVHILQGGQDTDVPPGQAHKLMQHLLHDPATLTLVPDGDHRLSRPQDIALLERALSAMIADQAG